MDFSTARKYFANTMSNTTSSRSNKYADNFQLFDKNFSNIALEVLNCTPYNLRQIVKRPLPRKNVKAENYLLSWLSDQYKNCTWRKNAALFQSPSIPSFCNLLVEQSQRPNILLNDSNKPENICVLIIELVSNRKSNLSYFNLVSSLTDMCRVYDQPSMCGFLFPAIYISHPVVYVEVTFNGIVYQVLQKVLTLDEVPIQVEQACHVALSKNICIIRSDACIGVIPRCCLNKYELVKAISRSLSEDRSILMKDELLTTLRYCEVYVGDIQHLNSGWNIVLSFADKFVIKIPARIQDVDRIISVKAILQSVSDHVVLPIWCGYVAVHIGNATFRKFIAIYDFLESESITLTNVYMYIIALIRSVKYIHGKGLAHRDIRMANIRFVQRDEHTCYAKLIDFDRSTSDIEKLENDWKDVRSVIIKMLICSLEAMGQSRDFDPDKKIQLRNYVHYLEKSRVLNTKKRPLIAESEVSSCPLLDVILENEGIRLLSEGGEKYDSADDVYSDGGYSDFYDMEGRIKQLYDSFL